MFQLPALTTTALRLSAVGVVSAMTHATATDPGVRFEELAPTAGRAAAKCEGVEWIWKIALTVGMVVYFDHGKITVGESDPEGLGFVGAAHAGFLSGTPPGAKYASLGARPARRKAVPRGRLHLS
jgi:hypothetical protein